MTNRVYCACCKRDITPDFMIHWVKGEPFCYTCATTRVKGEEDGLDNESVRNGTDIHDWHSVRNGADCTDVRKRKGKG